MRWLPRIDFGTEGYSEKVARRLRAVNIAAWSIAAAVAFFAVLRFADPRPEMLPRAIINAVAAMCWHPSRCCTGTDRWPRR